MISPYFEKFKYHPSVIANFDETMLKIGDRLLKVLTASEFRRTYKTLDPDYAHITLGPTIFADGTCFKILVILPLKTLTPELKETIMKGDFPDFIWSGQESGWINDLIFEDFALNHIIPEFKKRLERLGPDARGAFFVDGHGSRGNPKVMQAFSDARIDVFSFIAHASQAIQPLDLGYFKVFKSNLRRLRNNDITITSAEKRLELLLATKRALSLQRKRFDHLMLQGCRNQTSLSL
jgi:hypothetical protein